MKKIFLVLLDGDTVVQKVQITPGRFVIGRSDDADIVISSKDISRHHAALEYDGRRFMLVDLKSTNGTVVNGKRIMRQRVSVRDEIMIGDFTLVLDDSGVYSQPEKTIAQERGEDTTILEGRLASLRKKIDDAALADEFRTIERSVTESRRRLSKLAHRDKLTGLFSRQRFEYIAQTTLAVAQQVGGSVSFLFVDLDHFKEVNDAYGHEKGDQVLRAVTRLIGAACRKTDVVSRYGGEEIVVLLPDTSTDDAATVANDINRVIRQQSKHLVGITVTVSTGVATYPEHGTTLKEVLAHADKALYRAKELGRDRICIYEDTD